MKTEETVASVQFGRFLVERHGRSEVRDVDLDLAELEVSLGSCAGASSTETGSRACAKLGRRDCDLHWPVRRNLHAKRKLERELRAGR